MRGNIGASGVTERQLTEKLEEQYSGPIADIVLATLDGDGNLRVYLKEKNPSSRNTLQ